MFARIVIAALIVGGCAGAQEATRERDEPEWVSLFNGENLDGWTAHYASAPVDARPASDLFTVVGGAIHAYATDAAGSAQSQAFIVTHGEYSNYRLRLEYRWGDKKFPPRMDAVRDAGLLYHVYDQPPQNWPRSVEFQIQEGDTGDVWAISARATSTVDPATQLYALAGQGGAPVTVGIYDSYERIRHAAGVAEVAGWNTIEAVVRGDAATYLVNGVVNMRVSDMKSWDQANSAWVRLDHGKIALQAEYAELFYRNIQLRPLTQREMQGGL